MIDKLKQISSAFLLPIFLVYSNQFLPVENVNIRFYSENITLQYTPEMFEIGLGDLEEQQIVQFYQSLEDLPYEPFIRSIRKYQYKYELNDWLVYELILKCINQLGAKSSKKQKVLTTWFVLSKLGYDTRLAFLKNEAFIYARTIEDIYETPLIEDNGLKFVGLTEIQYKRTSKNKSVYLLNYLAAPNGKAFNFSLQRLPSLKTQQQQKKFRFSWEGETYEFPIQYDKTLVDIMKKYPVIGETDYLETPFSEVLKESLFPAIRSLLVGKTTKESLEIIASFTRSAFIYGEDEAYFNRSRPMIRDEVFFYPYSDCEDRSAVFYGLVEELLGLPMIVVAYADHLTIAVALDEPIGPSIAYKGKKFYICDPTGPTNSSEIGQIPRGYKGKPFDILMDNINKVD